MSDRAVDVMPEEATRITDANMSQAQNYESENEGSTAGTHARIPFMNRTQTNSSLLISEISAQSFSHDSVSSPVSRSDIVRYEQVPQQEQEETKSVEFTTSTSLPDTANHTAERPGPGTLRRSPYQWWLLTPMDVLLALTPLFFLSKVAIL
jgi:hypothetical protein